MQQRAIIHTPIHPRPQQLNVTLTKGPYELAQHASPDESHGRKRIILATIIGHIMEKLLQGAFHSLPAPKELDSNCQWPVERRSEWIYR